MAMLYSTFFHFVIFAASVFGKCRFIQMALASFARTGNDIAGRALQHRHMRGILGKRRNQRHRRSAASNHDDSLARIIESLGPLLRMQELPLKPFHARKLRAEAFFVAIVTAAHIKEAADQPDDPTVSFVCASTVQRASAEDQEARIIRCPSLMWRSMP